MPADGRYSLQTGENPLLTTVGIDVGSTTTHLTFSRIELVRVDSRYVVSRRDEVHRSRIGFTPYTDSLTIDSTGLSGFIDEEYRAAGLTRDAIDSGALLLTGLAAARHNARPIADAFAAEAGKLVAVAAGDIQEAVLATRGSGAIPLSAQREAPMVHVDVGGGTTKLAYLVRGSIGGVAAIDVGARLVLLDGEGGIVRVEEPARRMLDGLGIRWTPGRRPPAAEVEQLADHMAGQVLAHAGVAMDVPKDLMLLRTPPMLAPSESPIEALSFSGGVAEFIFGRADRQFGDLGQYLGDAIRRRVEGGSAALLPSAQGIRATVLGASQYTVQLSGATVHVSAAVELPLRNVPVVRPALDLDVDRLDGHAQVEVDRALARVPSGPGAVGVALRWSGAATHARLQDLARILRRGFDDRFDTKVGLVVVCDADVAALLGRHLDEIGGKESRALCIDGVEVNEYDFLDVGAFVPGTGALPVVVKSLVFPNSQEELQ